MATIAAEILLILLLLIANGVFALSEIAIVSARRARLQRRAEQGDRGAAIALELASDPTRFLSTVQIGITLVGILAGALSGATLAEAIGTSLATIPPLAPYGEAIGLAIVVVFITYFSLIIGELLPKQLALNDPETVAARIAGPMRQLSRMANPIVRFLSFSTNILVRLLGVRPPTEPPVTTEEIKILIQQGRSVGVLEEAEQDIMESALYLGDRRINGLMTPRTEIVWIDIDAPLETIQAQILASPHTHFPVARGSLDGVLGLVRGRDFLACQVRSLPIVWENLLNKPLFIPGSQTILDTLQAFKQSRAHTGLIIDEFGGVLGMATLTDILEALVGDLPTPGEALDTAIRREDGSWLLDGHLPVGELKDLLDLRALPQEETLGYATLAGFVLAAINQVPSVGQYFDYGKWRFEVVDMDGRRIDRVLATPLANLSESQKKQSN